MESHPGEQFPRDVEFRDAGHQNIEITRGPVHLRGVGGEGVSHPGLYPLVVWDPSVELHLLA